MGSPRAREGQSVVAGQELAAWGDSGNVTQPHLHVQARESGGNATSPDGTAADRTALELP